MPKTQQGRFFFKDIIEVMYKLELEIIKINYQMTLLQIILSDNEICV